MTKYAAKSIIKAICEIAEFIYTTALLVVKGSCNCVKEILNYV